MFYSATYKRHLNKVLEFNGSSRFNDSLSLRNRPQRGISMASLVHVLLSFTFRYTLQAKRFLRTLHNPSGIAVNASG